MCLIRVPPSNPRETHLFLKDQTKRDTVDLGNSRQERHSILKNIQSLYFNNNNNNNMSRRLFICNTPNKIGS